MAPPDPSLLQDQSVAAFDPSEDGEYELDNDGLVDRLEPVDVDIDATSNQEQATTGDQNTSNRGAPCKKKKITSTSDSDFIQQLNTLRKRFDT
ncbi:hypothetical protein HK102_002810, partial [Quaeritorhiza haematococci]